MSSHNNRRSVVRQGLRDAHEGAPPRPLSVLVVDDEDLVRKFVERVLRDAGYQTATASDGPEALEVAAKLEHFDILVTDVMMPQMTGDELARRVCASATPASRCSISPASAIACSRRRSRSGPTRRFSTSRAA